MKSSIALFFSRAFVYSCYRDYRPDLFRVEVFPISGELFEYAASGALPFDSSAYRLLRKYMNDVIRYVHALTFSRFIVSYSPSAVYPNSTKNAVEEWGEALAEIESSEVLNRLNALHNRAARVIAGQIFNRLMKNFHISLI